MEAININHLTKDFGQGRGVYEVNLAINQGECFGYLGPNGAGKSTTIRILMGFTKPDKGECFINGYNTAKDREKAMEKVSYIPGEIALPRELTGLEVLNIQKQLKNVCDDTFLNFLIEEFELDTSLKCKQMSLGMRRKLIIVSAFMNDPDIIIMDEPSSGLDPKMQDKFISLIKAEKARGKTILLSSHIFREVDVSCDRIAIIKDGHIVSFFDAKDLKHNSLKTYELFLGNEESYSRLEKPKGDLYKVLEKDRKNLRLLVSVDDSKITDFISLLGLEDILDFKERKQTLEDYFMSFYKEEKSFIGL